MFLSEGYGQTGPYRTSAGYDVIIEAEAGLMHMFVESLSKHQLEHLTLITQPVQERLTDRLSKWVSLPRISRLGSMHMEQLWLLLFPANKQAKESGLTVTFSNLK